MAIRRIRIDYVVYAPGFKPGESPCWEFQTFAQAKRKARVLGTGALVYRNFSQTNKRDEPLGGWWGDKVYWRWDGTKFDRLKEIGKQVGTG